MEFGVAIAEYPYFPHTWMRKHHSAGILQGMRIEPGIPEGKAEPPVSVHLLKLALDMMEPHCESLEEVRNHRGICAESSMIWSESEIQLLKILFVLFIFVGRSDGTFTTDGDPLVLWKYSPGRHVGGSGCHCGPSRASTHVVVEAPFSWYPWLQRNWIREPTSNGPTAWISPFVKIGVGHKAEGDGRLRFSELRANDKMLLIRPYVSFVSGNGKIYACIFNISSWSGVRVSGDD